MTIEQRLVELGVTLPKPWGVPADFRFVRAVTTEGNLVFVSGHGPRQPDGTTVNGKLGAELDIEAGYAAARLTVLQCLASLKAEIGDLDRVRRVVKLLGFVNCTEKFGDQPRVMNGASDLLVELFGERGKHARSAVGMQSLPGGMCVEIEMVVEIGPAS